MLGGFFKQAADAAGNAAKAAQEAADQAARAAQEAAEQAANAAHDAAGQAANAAQDAAGEAAKMAHAAADNAAHVAGDAAGAAQGAAADVAGAAVRVATNIPPAAAEAATVAAGAVAKAIDDVKMSIYQPVTREYYESEHFDLPKMVVIADASNKRDVDKECDAIGWLSKEADIRVFHLYEDAVVYSGLKFKPSASQDALYYADGQEERSYFNLQNYFELVRADKITELRNIAYSLGAKCYKLELLEEKKSLVSKKNCAGIGEKDNWDGSMQLCSTEESSETKRSNMFNYHLLSSQTFEGDAEPHEPELKWFKAEPDIRFLIKTRCGSSDSNTTKHYALEISSASASGMSVALASKIDAAVDGMKLSANFSCKTEATKESRQKFQFIVDF